MGKNANFAELRRGLGLVRGLGDEFMQACERVNPPVAALHRLVTSQGHGTMDEMVRLAVAAWQAEQPQPSNAGHLVGDHPYRSTPTDRVELPVNHYRVRVNRGPLPPMTTLEEMYSKDGVSALYNGSYTWTKDRSRTGANDVIADEVVIVAKQFTAEEIREMGGLTSENIIAWGSRNGLVVADEKETHAFGINPETCDLQRSRWLVGLGSSALRGGDRCVAMLHGVSGGRVLDDYWFEVEWLSDGRFLFVRK